MNSTHQTIAWSGIALGVLIALNEGLAWAGSLQYLWGTLVVILGIWLLSAKD